MTHYRTIFISDLHLGSRGAQADALLDFLHHNTSDNLYLVGDIIDGWALKRKLFFPESHQKVLHEIYKRILGGTPTYYTPGNHDEDFRKLLGSTLGNLQIQNEFIHVAADAKRYLVVHGDCYDNVCRYAKWLAVLGDVGYNFLLRTNSRVNAIRRWFGFGYWSLSAFVKSRIKGAVSFIGEYENSVARSVRERGLDGVVCGHIHHAEMRMMDGVRYMNDGDWVETCSALVEHHDGRMELVYWRPSVDMSIAA